MKRREISSHHLLSVDEVIYDNGYKALYLVTEGDEGETIELSSLDEEMIDGYIKMLKKAKDEAQTIGRLACLLRERKAHGRSLQDRKPS